MSKRTQLLRYMKKKQEEKTSVVLNGEKLDMCSEALEKQVAKKPRYTTIFEGEKAEKLKAKNLPNFEIYKCPICNNSVAERTFATSLHPGGFIKDNYCSKCGKKMDWSGTDGL